MRNKTNQLWLLLLAICFGSAAVVYAHPGGRDKNNCHVDSKDGKQHCHKKMPPIGPSKPWRAGDEGALYGNAVHITDGDTLVVKIQGAELTFRLADIDAPELKQPFGANARQELTTLIGNQQCVLVPVDTDPYDRFVVYLWVGETYVNGEMMKRGMGWFDSKFARDPLLFQLENEARDAKRGLWALPLKDRVEPWVWRREQR